MTPACWSPSARPPIISKAVAEGQRDAKAGGQLGHQRIVRPPQQRGQGRSRPSPVSAAAARRHYRPDRRRYDFGQNRQGPVRDRLERGRRSARQIVEQRGMKQVTDFGAIEKTVDEIIANNPDKVADAKDQSEGDRLVRRPGDEVFRRQSEPASRQRHSEKETRALTRARLHVWVQCGKRCRVRTRKFDRRRDKKFLACDDRDEISGR